MGRSDELKASPPMFENRVLDRFTRVHPSVPPLLFGPVIAVLLVTGVGRMGALNGLLLAVAGYVFWTLFEYWLHRVVFHFEPYSSQLGMRLHWMLHGVHHDHPNDPLRLVMPPSVSVPLGAAVLAAFWGVLGYDAALCFGGGFLVGYLAYDMLHYHVHHHTPRTAVEYRLRELHMRHHFQDDERGFGISAPYWDRVFGTAPAERGSRVVGGQAAAPHDPSGAR
jgi:dihydroceramide fatty acyl 2-hydroxylase